MLTDKNHSSTDFHTKAASLDSTTLGYSSGEVLCVTQRTGLASHILFHRAILRHHAADKAMHGNLNLRKARKALPPFVPRNCD
jgi:hypothetical protein